MKDMVDLIHSLPLVEPPEDLTGRVMGSLPRRTWLMTRRGCELKRSTCYEVARKLLLPSGPAELGLLLLSLGFLFLCLVPAVMLGLYLSGLPVVINIQVLSLLPALAGAVLIFRAGLAQINSSRAILPQRLRIGIAGLMFGLTMVLGWGSGTCNIMNMITAWLGVSGVIVTCLLPLVPRFLNTGREERYA